MMGGNMVPFFGFYCGVPMTGNTPSSTLLRAADAADRMALSGEYQTTAQAEALMDAARRMRESATPTAQE